ncbi:uncharacterized protein LOC122531951 [Frieseomelitta varia]|uniref:uncharacterized protein LOC122531951 n=1 Tax=Frieseomelitta varia TaxID=561572 RepID=UPI001CB6A09E|nr:uncharacterized protein LOC122531951 [Frieseomelitta varia]
MIMQVSTVNSNAFHLEQRSTSGSHVFRFLALLLDASNSRLIEVLVARAPARPSKRKNTPTPIIRGGKREEARKAETGFTQEDAAAAAAGPRKASTPRLPRWDIEISWNEPDVLRSKRSK